MEYTINKEDLKNPLLAETLSALAACFAELDMELYVVGAVARDIAMHLLQMEDDARRTMDLDVAVLIKNWRQYDQLSEVLLRSNFTKAREKQRFFYVGENGTGRFMVDIVPFGDIAHNEQVAWPPEGTPVMSVRCFDDVMLHADKVRVEDSFSFSMAPLSGQFLIKLDAWSDRHLITKKDAADMVYIMQNVYVPYAMSRQTLPPEISIEASEFELLVAGAEWIAVELRQMLSEGHRHFYATMLNNEVSQAEQSALLNDMMDVSSARNYRVLRRALSRMAQILVS